VGIAFGVVGRLIAIGAVVQGVRRWHQGDRLPVLIVVGIIALSLLTWLLLRLLPLTGLGGH
jgi:hypothetical protein